MDRRAPLSTVHQPKARQRAIQKRSVVTVASDLPEPHRICDDDFGEIADRFKIPLARRPELRDFLDELVEVFAKGISRERSRPNRKADRAHLDKARNALKKARFEVNLGSGPAAKAALSRTAACIGEMLSSSWISNQFPDDPNAPALRYWPNDDHSGRGPSRVSSRPIPIDDLSADERIFFARHRPRELVSAVLDVLEAALADARSQIVAPRTGAKRRGGRNPLTHRRYMLANLVRFWRVLGRDPGKGMKSGFPQFAEEVCTAIGWPSDGVAADLPKATKLSLNWC